MADQNITALPVSTAPASSDQLLLVGAAEEKLIDYDKLADAILSKLTSKNFSLDQGTMTLMSALNQLNSKAFLMKQYTFSTSDKKLIFTVKFQSGSHCFGFLGVDANRSTDVYALGEVSGVNAMIKKSAYPVPTMNKTSGRTELKIEMDTWAKAFLITVDSVEILTSEA